MKTLALDLQNRTYTAEVLRSKNPAAAIDQIRRLLTSAKSTSVGEGKKATSVVHGFVTSGTAYHRAVREVVGANGERRPAPQQKQIRNSEVYLYDAVLAN